jgi:hypothetical protein
VKRLEKIFGYLSSEVDSAAVKHPDAGPDAFAARKFLRDDHEKIS